MDKTILAYININDSYLMLYRNKKKNDLNEGKWMGVGGHIELGETPEQALIREVKEETGLIVLDYNLRGTLYFYNDDYSEVIYLYTVNEVKGEIIDCNEGELKLIPINEIMNLNMWEGDKVFLELLKNNEPYFELNLYYKNKDLIKVERIK